MRYLLAILLAASLCTVGHASEVAVAVVTADGVPLPDAVVTVFPNGKIATPPLAGPFTIAQRDITFDPFVLIVPKGAEVHFPNFDKVRHHVYSFSKGNRFEIKLYGREDDRAQVFENDGTVALGCNIHDGMIGFIRVVETGLAGKTDKDGRVTIANVPAGNAIVKVWHPYLQKRDQEVEMSVTVPADGAARADATLEIRAPETYWHLDMAHKG
jgi:hypothetical protein